jgi:HTH-type transcriptional regulator, competence development regulator
MSFGKWLLDARKKAGLTQEQLAERSGLSPSYISALERQEPNTRAGEPRMPRPETVNRIAKALGIPSGEARAAAGYASLIIPPFPKKPKNLTQFLEQLESMGFEQFDFAADFMDWTEDDFEELLERIAADVNLMIRRKNK